MSESNILKEKDNQPKSKKLNEEIIEKHRKRYLKKEESEMTEEEKREEEATRDLNNGPTSDSKRGCTDILCCLFFIVFIAGCIVITILGFSKGNPYALTMVYDEDGNACGKIGGKAENFPYVYLYKTRETSKILSKNALKSTICVKECPSSYSNTTISCLPTANNTNCIIEDINLYLSSPFLKKICFPDYDFYKKALESNSTSNRTKAELDSDFTLTKSLINNNFISIDKLFTYIGDFELIWPIILACIGIAVVVGFLYLLIVRCCGSVIAYTSILLILAALIALGFLFYNRMSLFTSQEDSVYRNIQLGFAVVFWSLSLIWFLIVICSCNKIRLSIAITQVAATFVWKVMSILFVPFVFFLIISLYFAYWIALSLFLYSTGDVSPSQTVFWSNVTWDETTRYAWWYHVFALLYITAFIEAMAMFVYSSTACIWYFEQGGTDNHVNTPVLRSFWRVFRFHFGSLAFGSLIIAVIRLIMLVISYIRYQIESSTGPKETAVSKFYKCLLNIVLCLLSCIEKCMEFINKHAYIQIALKGRSFCRSAFDGFAIIIRNLGRWTALTAIGGVFNMIGKVFIAGLTGVCGYLIITKAEVYSSKLNSPLLPTLVFVLVGYLIGSVFISIYGNAADSLMHCFLVDCEINRDPKHSPSELRDFVQEEKDN